MKIRNILSTILSITCLMSSTTLPILASGETEYVNVLNYQTAAFTILSSAGTTDGAPILDGNILTSASVTGYNGAPIYNVNGDSGNDYMMLLTLQSTSAVPAEVLRLYRSYNPEMYKNKSTLASPTGVDIFISYTGEDDSWIKTASIDNLNTALANTVRDAHLFDGTDGTRWYYDINLGEAVSATYYRIAIRNIEPWLGAINFTEAELLTKKENISPIYQPLSVKCPDSVKYEISTSSQLYDTNGNTYVESGASVTITATANELWQVASAKLNGKSIHLANNSYTFTMPASASVIEITASPASSENIPLEVISKTVAGNQTIYPGVIPVVTFQFNKQVGEINKTMILVNGQSDTGLIQNAFRDATDYTKVYVIPYSDKLEADTTYKIELADTVTSIVGISLSGEASVKFKTSKNYKENAETNNGYIEGFSDGTFRPDEYMTIKESLDIAKNLKPDSDFSVVLSSDEIVTRLDMAQIIYIMRHGSSYKSRDIMFDLLVEEGVIRGYPDGTYKRENKITRAEAVVLFNRAIGRSEAYGQPTDIFTDVPSESWAASQIAAAVSSVYQMEIPWTKEISDVSFDENNVANNIWTQIPLVTQEQRNAGISGGEGGQWMQAIEVDNVDGSLLFAGIDIGGMLRSTDGGKTWHRSYDGFMATGCVDIEIDPNNKNNVLAIGSVASGSPKTGIYLSNDMGESWQHVHSFIFDGQRDTRDQIAWDKSSCDSETGGSKIAYWSTLWHVTSDNLANPHMSGSDFYTHNTPGLMKTEDGGKTWFCVNSQMSDSVVKVHPTKGYVYVGNERGFFRSEDGGKTFTQIISGTPIYGLDVIETYPDNVYINDETGVLVSTDSGKNFKRRKPSGFDHSGFPRSSDLNDVRNITQGLAVSPANPDYMLVDSRDYLNYNNRRFYSTDGGKTWRKCSYDDSKDFFFNHNRQHPFAWHPTDENKVWSLGGDWITSSSNAGKTFVWDSNGVCGTPPGGRINFYPFNTDIIYASVQDLRGALTTDGGYTWIPTEAENGFGCSYGAFSPDGKLIVAGEAEHWYEPRYITVSRDGGETWTDTGLLLGRGTERRATSFWGSISHNQTIFAGQYVSRDNANSWTAMDNCQLVMAQNYHHNKELYGITYIADGGYNEYIVVSYDNGRTWLPFLKTKLNISRTDSVHTWDVEYDGINEILYYMPGNQSTAIDLIKVTDNIQTSISDNLQTMDIQDTVSYQIMALDPRHPEILYVGGYIGNGHATNAVQRSCDSGETFKIISSMGDSKSIVKSGPSAGSGPETLVVKPDTGELWMWDRAEGFWKFPAPYTN